MNWDDLRVFLALARAPTLAVAARNLGIDATTVGRRLRRLEAELDSALIEPGVRGHSLTHQGQRLLGYAETVEHTAGAARGEISGARAMLAGTLRVSIAEGLGTWLVARHLPAFQAANPHIQVELVSTNGFLNPSKREADLAIMLARPAKGPLIVRRLTGYALGLYASHDYVARCGAPADIGDLRGHALVGYIPDFIYAEELRYLHEVAPNMAPHIASSSINIQHRLTQSGGGLCVLPCFIGDQDAQLERLLDHQVTIQRSFWLVVHQDVRALARVAAFIDWLDQLVRSHQGLLTGRQSGDPAEPLRGAAA